MIRRPPRSTLFPYTPLSRSYCMPLDGPALAPPADVLTAAEIETVARAALAAGFRKLRLTGGEPTLRDDLEQRSEEHTSELQSQSNLVCRLLLEKKKQPTKRRGYARAPPPRRFDVRGSAPGNGCRVFSSTRRGYPVCDRSNVVHTHVPARRVMPR